MQELHLLGTILERFPKEAFRILGNLTLLNIDGHRMTQLPGDIFTGSMAAGILEEIHITNGNNTKDNPKINFYI